MPTSTSPAVIEGDLNHTFHFDPTFKYVHLLAHSELRFFSEAFSLIDSMRNVDLLLDFSQRLRKTDGVLECKDMIDVLRKENLIDLSSPNEDEGLHFLLDNMYRIIYRIVADRFVTCMNTSSLGVAAWNVGQQYLAKSNNNNEDPKSTGSLLSTPGRRYWKEKSEIWIDMSERLQELAKFQHSKIKIHHDFQKKNYAPDPRSKYAYGSTVAILLIGFMYLLLKNVKYAEARELILLLRK